ncbi:MAG: DUF4190 domain-containing protein [Verrucomicrobia bacterium]|nr:MAG: DUF4190 domain-containing protein [Verrucomicrobiota bacterium]
MASIESYFCDIGSDDYGSCCVSARNTLLNIENEVVHDEDKERHLRMVQELWDALGVRLREVGDDSPEGQLVRFLMEYLSLIKAFLRNTYGVRFAGIRFDPERLQWHAEAFDRMRAALPGIPPEYRASAEERIALAAKWCRDRKEYIHDWPDPSLGSDQRTVPLATGAVRNEPLADWCMWLGVAGLLCCQGFVLSIAAIILGNKAIAKINKSNGKLRGKEKAIIGLVLGFLSILLGIIILILRNFDSLKKLLR